MKIKIKYLADITPIKKEKGGDLVDLRCAEEVHMKKGEYKLIPLGVAMELPTDYEAHIYSRSSTPSKWGIISANSVGIVDSAYRGDSDQWFYPAIAVRDTVIPFDTRIAQFKIVHNQPEFIFEQVEHLDNVNRGGIGSTGER